METIEHVIQQPAKRVHQTPLLFQHGAWHGAWCWQAWMDYFASLGYETHAISLPGHGNSSMHKKHLNLYSFKDYVNTLSDQIESISPQPVVIAHSLGGAVLQKYLENHSMPGAVFLSTLPSNGILSMCLRLLQRHPLPILSGILKLNFYEWVKTPKLAQELFLNKDTQIDIISFQKQLVGESAMVAVGLLFPFAKVNPNESPMLFISGDKDAVFTLKEQDRTAKKYDSKNLVIENQAHNLMMESAWKQVADVIDNWLTYELALP